MYFYREIYIELYMYSLFQFFTVFFLFRFFIYCFSSGCIPSPVPSDTCHWFPCGKDGGERIKDSMNMRKWNCRALEMIRHRKSDGNNNQTKTRKKANTVVVVLLYLF